MNRTAKTLLAVFFALAAASAGVYFGVNRFSADNTEISGTDTKLLFAQTLPDTAGNVHKLADYRGKVIVVNFWASWCLPCVEEIPEFSRLQTDYADKNVQFIGIGIDNASNIASFEKKVTASYPLLVAGATGSELARQFGNTMEALPFTLILDRSGAIKASKLGRVTEKELHDWIESTL